VAEGAEESAGTDAASTSQYKTYQLRVNVDYTEVKYGNEMIWTAGGNLPTLDRGNLPRDVRAVVAHCMSNIGENGKLDVDAVKEVFEANDDAEGDRLIDLGDGTTAPLPKRFLNSFDILALESAFETLNQNYIPNGGDQCPGEHYFERHVYTPVYRIFEAAANGKTRKYRANQFVNVGNFYHCADGIKHTLAMLSARPDGAVLHQDNLPIGVAELKPKNASDASDADLYKCVVYTVFTNLVLANSKKYGVPIPFVTTGGTSGGFSARLFVATFSSSSSPAPVISEIKPSGNWRSFLMNERVPRLELSVLIFALLGNAMARLRDDTIPRVCFRKGKNALNSANETARSPIGTGQSPQSGGGGSVGGGKRGRGGGGASGGRLSKRARQSGATLFEAMSAASLGGRVVDLSPAFPVNAVFPDPRARSHYFRGVFRKSGKPVFVKVICGEADDEVRLQRLAHGGCRVPEVLDDWKTEGCHVIVMEFVDDYAVDRDSVRAFAVSLIRAVMALHACGILHCDLKPDNVMSDGESVAIVDFGHSQFSDGAQSYRATRGFMAPEVAVDKKPHSAASDSFSVGKTLEQVVAETGAHDDKDLAAIIAGLTKADVAERRSLSDALETLDAPSPPSNKRLPPTIPKIAP